MSAHRGLPKEALETMLTLMAGRGSVGGFRGVGEEEGRRAGEERGVVYLGILSKRLSFFLIVRTGVLPRLTAGVASSLALLLPPEVE